MLETKPDKRVGFSFGPQRNKALCKLLSGAVISKPSQYRNAAVIASSYIKRNVLKRAGSSGYSLKHTSIESKFHMQRGARNYRQNPIENDSVEIKIFECARK